MRFYKSHKSNKPGKPRKFNVWEINVIGDSLVMEDYVIDEAGNESIHKTNTETVIPKANRTLEEQIDLRLNSRIKKKMDKGYTTDIPEDDILRNQLGYPLHMLADVSHNPKTQKKKYSNGNKYFQPKLNGHRAALVVDDGVLYSRGGTTIHLPHLIEASTGFPDGIILDGELYCHGMPLQEIGSLIKDVNKDASAIEFWVYDMIDHELPYRKRLEILETIEFNGTIKLCPTKAGHTDDINGILEEYLKDGFEGGIMRSPDGMYLSGHRNIDLVKLKVFFDKEYTILDICKTEKGTVVCDLGENGVYVLTVTAPGTVKEKEWMFENKEKFMGKEMTIKYSELTKDGIPFHPVAIGVREDI